jgi:glycosyltransferase involved in cell wall biosynthesis
MYSRSRIGVILPAKDTVSYVKEVIGSIPPYVDRVYVIGNGLLSGEPGARAEIEENPRVSLVISDGGAGGDAAFTPAYMQAVRDRMDVVVVVNGSSLNDAKYLPSLLDPIVWGEADLTKVKESYNRGNRVIPPAQDGLSPRAHPVTQTKITLNYRDLVEAMDTNIGISRNVLELIKDTPEHGMKDRILLAIPCMKESFAVGSVILQAHQYVNEILVMNGGCPEETLILAKRAGAKVLTKPGPVGYDEGTRLSFDYARKHDFDILVTMKGDGQHNPRFIPGFLNALNGEGTDVVIGSRFLADASHLPLYRRYAGQLLDRLTGFASSQEINDSQSGFRAFGKRAIDAVDPVGTGTGIDGDILGEIHQKDLTVRLIPVGPNQGSGGAPGHGAISHGLGVIRAVINLIGYEHPMLTFGLAGSAATVMSFIFGFMAFSTYYTTNKLPYGPSMASGILLILGLFLITAGFILDTMVQLLKQRKQLAGPIAPKGKGVEAGDLL